MRKQRRCVIRSIIATTSICPISPRFGDAGASSRHGYWTSPQPRWRKTPGSVTLSARSPILVRGAGQSRQRLMRLYQCPCFLPRFTNASARAARRRMPTNCCRQCATNSAGTWRDLLHKRELDASGRAPGMPDPGFSLHCRRTARGSPCMNIEVHSDDRTVADAAATMIANMARAAMAARERFIMAVSGGRTPWLMLGTLADAQLRWEKIHIAQVDERVAS